MARSTLPGTEAAGAAAELADWYADRLRPRLARAARERKVSAQAVAELELQIATMLGKRAQRRAATRRVPTPLRRSKLSPRAEDTDDCRYSPNSAGA